MKIEDIPPLM